MTRNRIIIGLLGALALGLLIFGITLLDPELSIDALLDEVRRLPFPAFIVLSGVLPLMGVPMTALYLIAGAVYLPILGFPVTVLGVTAGVMINLVLCHVLAGKLRHLPQRLLRRFGLKIPDLPKESLWKLVLMVRITPGAPLVAQNVLLSLAGVPMAVYLMVSAPAELLISIGYLTLGSSFGTGNWQFLLVGLGLIGMSLLAINLLRASARRKQLADVTKPEVT